MLPINFPITVRRRISLSVLFCLLWLGLAQQVSATGLGFHRRVREPAND